MATNTAYQEEGVSYQLLDDGTFVIESYNQARPFASFFPGIAGLKGIPMWAFYVNRNQAIASFGVNNKNNSLMEFFPANNAYAAVANVGFRTFVKLIRGRAASLYEPFAGDAPDSQQRMLVRPHELVLEDIDASRGLKTTVHYFTLPEEPIAALARIVEFENIGREHLDMEIVDGLPKIIPYWMSMDTLKSMSYTAQAWTTVTNLREAGVPFYRLKVEISDSPEVTGLKKGNFYFGLVGNGRETVPAEIIIDPEVIFGEDKSFRCPGLFMKQARFAFPEQQEGDNKYPSAMSFFSLSLAPGISRALYSMAGHISSEEKLNRFVARAKNPGYFGEKAQENRAIVETLTHRVATESGCKEFDLYCRQTYLDNLLRGGMPISLPSGDRKIPFYVYSRKHGDLERDYNFFQLAATYYSQGNGNFRDVNQNKRNDVFFAPAIGDFNVISFYNLVQLDGYNPLVVKGSLFSFKHATARGKEVIRGAVEKRYRKPLAEILERHFDPGTLLLELEDMEIPLKVAEEEFLRRILDNSERINEAEHGEGFWIDHWTYNLDLLESFLSIYPEKEREILLEKKEFTFYDNAHVVVPRARKYVDAGGKVRQFGAVAVNIEKGKLIRGRTDNIHAVRTKQGKGEIYRTTLLAKMVCLLLNKLASLDPEGIGMEMEADKPGWYDALNGLPGVFGSSICEMFELKRMIQFLQRHLASLRTGDDYRIALPEEMHRFFAGLDALLKRKGQASPFAYWNAASGLKEKYRESVLFGVSGREKAVSRDELGVFLRNALAKLDSGIGRARDKKSGLYPTYFSYEALRYRRNGEVNSKGLPCVTVTKFRKRVLPLFLEGEVHYIKTEHDIEKVRQLHQSVKSSGLFDARLGMYKVNESLAGEPADIGRCTVFAPGWLENESIWLHMEYKYLLELLKAELYDEFFAEFRKTGVCFQNPRVYGRSILENSSFIVSSAFHDERVWGRGFVARLSGSTAEFIEMWLLMTVGPKPFILDDEGDLTLEFNPALRRDFFTKQNTFSFLFLGTTLVKYHNPQRLDTYGGQAGIKRMSIHWADGVTEPVNGKTIRGDTARRIRSGEAKLIEVFF